MSFTENICITKSNIIKHVLTWKIDNFSAYDGDNDVIRSSIFPNKNENNVQWFLSLSPKQKNSDGYKTYLFLTLVTNNKIEFDLRAKINMCFLDYENKKMHEVKMERTHIFTGQDNGYQVPIFMTQYNNVFKNKDQLYPKDQLTVYFEITVIGQSCNVNIIKSNIDSVGNQVHENFEQWLDNKELSDITLTVEDKEFKAHKIILATRSPVFAAMFRHNMAENLNNRVNITDMTHEVFRKLLTFICTGGVDVENATSELLSVADKYGLKQLKIICEDVLSEELSVENAAEYLVLADLHSCDTLRFRAIDFILNAPQVIDTEGWRHLLKAPHVLDLLVRAQAKLLSGK